MDREGRNKRRERGHKGNITTTIACVEKCTQLNYMYTIIEYMSRTQIL